MSTKNLSTKLNKRRSLASKRLVALAGIFLTASALSATVRTWVGTAGNNLLGDANNWSPSGVPNASVNDTLQFNGSQAGNLLLTNSTANFDANPGFYINVA